MEHTDVRVARGAQQLSGNANFVTEREFWLLRRLDAENGRGESSIFLWGNYSFRTTQWVGTIGVPGLELHVLPKTRRSTDSVESEGTSTNDAHPFAQLFHMLAISGILPARVRDLANVDLGATSVRETVFSLFARCVVDVLRGGASRNYVTMRDNLAFKRGKIHLPTHLRRNAANRSQFFCQFDEFSTDNGPNRLLLWGLDFVGAATASPSTRRTLTACRHHLADVSCVEPCPQDFDDLQLPVAFKHYQVALDYCALFYRGKFPTPGAMRVRSASLFFDMNRVFEAFVCALVRRAGRLLNASVAAQGRGARKFVAVDDAGGLFCRLVPDLVVSQRGASRVRRCVIDTKWKLPAVERGTKSEGVSADLYQLLAYHRGYGPLACMLLYPTGAGAQPRNLSFLDPRGDRCGRLFVRRLNVDRPLQDRSERQKIGQEVLDLLKEALMDTV